jgi:hypothetical protein
MGKLACHFSIGHVPIVSRILGSANGDVDRGRPAFAALPLPVHAAAFAAFLARILTAPDLCTDSTPTIIC